MMKYGCIGEHLGHSFSKEIHAAFADYTYELCELAPDELDRFLRAGAFDGINVTIPYKRDVIPYLSEISDAARKIGAVNTVLSRNGRLIGHNTDFYGLTALILRVGVPLQGKKVAILGTGGTARTAHAVADSLGAGAILTVSRHEGEGVVTYSQLLAEHPDVEYVINTTPLGMFPHLDGMAIDPADFASLAGVADAVYNPLRSRLILRAKERGIPAEGGLFMLVAQAVRASELFLDKTYPTETVERVYQSIRQRKENIVLIGMPGAGKTTVGKLLSSTLGRECIDTDQVIEKATGRRISEIFAAEGEAGFREIESRVIREEIAPRSGCIVATGGGAILRENNVTSLRQNGRIYFIDRPVEELLPTEDRPLALSRDAILARYHERYARYCAVADRRIPVTGDAESVSLAIGKDSEIE